MPEPIIRRADDQVYAPADPDYAPPILAAAIIYPHKYSADGARRGRNHHILDEDIYIFGRQKPRFSFKGYSEVYNTSDITIRNVYQNGKKLLSPEDYTLEADECCKNITVESKRG